MVKNNAVTIGFDMDFNVNHPELQSGERFLTNAGYDHYCEYGYKTKRRGTVAYTITGMRIVSTGLFFPVFIKIKEYEEVQRHYEKTSHYKMII